MQPKLTSPVALLSSAWRLFSGNWKTLVPIILLPSIGSAIGQLFAQSGQGLFVILGVLISIAAAVFSVIMAPAFVNAIHRISTEPGVALSLKSQYRFGFTLFWSVLLIGIINGLAFLGSVFFLVIPAIIIGIYGSQYVFTLVIDGKKGFSSLTESYSLVRGRWWPVFGRALFIGLIMVVAWVILAGLGFLLSSAFGIHAPAAASSSARGAVSFGAVIISIILNLIMAGVFTPVVLAYAYRLYVSLKETRTADIQTSSFKKWLIAFMCLAIIPLLGIFIAIPLVALSTARHNAEDASASIQAQMLQAQRLMQGATTTLPLQNI
jgi:hypothetical protein